MGASTLDDVTVAYIPQNMPPAVKSINVFTVAAPVSSYSKSSAASSATAAYSITVTDTWRRKRRSIWSARPHRRCPALLRNRSTSPGRRTIRTGDRLVYELSFRGYRRA